MKASERCIDFIRLTLVMAVLQVTSPGQDAAAYHRWLAELQLRQMEEARNQADMELAKKRAVAERQAEFERLWSKFAALANTYHDELKAGKHDRRKRDAVEKAWDKLTASEGW